MDTEGRGDGWAQNVAGKRRLEQEEESYDFQESTLVNKSLT